MGRKVPKYVLDTNIYIRATRDWQFKEELKQFLAANTPWIHLHSVVAHELLAGAVTDELNPDPAVGAAWGMKNTA